MTNTEFEELVRQYERLVYTVCYQFVRDVETAQDLAQDTFMSAYLHRTECPKDSYKPWLARIAANKAKDYLKSAYHRKSIATEDDAMPQTSIAFTPQPDDITIDKDCAQRIKRQILALPEPYYLVSKMFFIEQRTVEEISSTLHRPPKTVHSQLSRAKAKLREVIERGTAT